MSGGTRLSVAPSGRGPFFDFSMIYTAATQAPLNGNHGYQGSTRKADPEVKEIEENTKSSTVQRTEQPQVETWKCTLPDCFGKCGHYHKTRSAKPGQEQRVANANKGKGKNKGKSPLILCLIDGCVDPNHSHDRVQIEAHLNCSPDPSMDRTAEEKAPDPGTLDEMINEYAEQENLTHAHEGLDHHRGSSAKIHHYHSCEKCGETYSDRKSVV